MALNALFVLRDQKNRIAAEEFLEGYPGYAPMGYFTDLTDALEAMDPARTHVIVLEGNPCDFYKTDLFPDFPEDIPLVFWDEHKSYIMEAYSKSELGERLSHPSAEHEDTVDSQDDSIIFVKADAAIWRVDLNTLIFAEAQKDYVLLHTPKQELRILSSMKHLMARLPRTRFLRVHRSFMVRVDAIDSIENDIIRAGGKKIPVGPSYRQRLLGRLKLI